MVGYEEGEEKACGLSGGGGGAESGWSVGVNETLDVVPVSLRSKKEGVEVVYVVQ